MKHVMHDQTRISVITFFVLTVLVWNIVGYEFVSSYSAGELVRCIEREREALVRFKKGLIINNSGLLSSWGSEDDKKECCEWEGVGCSNTTGHVIVLLLHGNRSSGGYYLGGEISSALLQLHHLKVLDLSGNDFGRNRIPEFICSMMQLQRLNLSVSSFYGTIPPQIGNLTNLQTLDLSWNDFGRSKIPESIGSMKMLEELNLMRSSVSGTIPLTIGNLTNMKTLDLSHNDFGKSKIPESIGSMKMLEELSLSWSNFSGIVPPQIGNITNLETLDLSCNDFGKSKIPESMGSMKKLEHLNLGYSFFSGVVPHQLWNFTNLKTLDLSSNDFVKSKIPESIGSMKKLEELNLVDSNFSGIVPPQLGNLTNLQTLDLSSNYFLIIDNLHWLNSHFHLLSRLDFSYVNITDPNGLQYVLNLPSLQEIKLQNCGLIDAIKPHSFLVNFSSSTTYSSSSLRELDMRSNKLKRLPSSIWQLLKLEKLDVSFNLLDDTITEANLTNLHNLKYLDLSSNWLILRLKPNWAPPFQLDFINLGGCDVGERFPLWLRKQSNLKNIDLSVAGLKDEVPNWFWDFSVGLGYLNLSHNHLTGIISDFSLLSINVIDVSYNEFSGPIPLFPAGASIIQLSQNMFSGSISSLCAFESLGAFLIDLSNNQLVGELPNCWENTTGLGILNLANNRFSGEIPRAVGSLSELWILQLGNNKLSGELPSTLKNCKNMRLIDVGGNMLTGNIPSWIGAANHERMAFFIFRNNRFQGSIPPQICSLTQMQVLDLSGNHLSGKIPPCFNKFNLLAQIMNTKISPISTFSSGLTTFQYVDSAILSWKGQYLQYRRSLAFLKLIDLSSNKLVGDIPQPFFSLRGLISLNLSRNSLTGIIHPDIGEMKMLEVLDLSSNQLSGAIPNGMTQLHFLAVLDFTNNNLSSTIPTGGQLQTFDASSYAGNTAGLCGSPLPLCPREGSDPSINNKAGDVDDDDGILSILSLSFLKEIGISVMLGFLLGFWGVVGSLIVSESWRRVFFNFWGAVWDWLYVITAISWAKLRRS